MMTGTIFMTEVVCCNCYTHFGMDSDLNKAKREDGKLFYCPNGHGQHYTESEIDRLKKENKRIKDDLFWSEKAAENARQDAVIAKKQKAAIKGQLTKTRNRIANGVCPCCHRTFKQLASHMINKHPDFKEAVG